VYSNSLFAVTLKNSWALLTPYLWNFPGFSG
jgi:hypothetical protein